jgi:hypothetical protein
MSVAKAAAFQRTVLIDDEDPSSGLSAGEIDRLPHVTALLNYMVPTSEKPRSYQYEPPPGVPRISAAYESHSTVIRDIRPVASKLSLDAEGFRLLRHVSAVRDFYDANEVRGTYYPEVERLVARATGAVRVVVFDHTIRRRLEDAEVRTSTLARQPVPRVHNDYTVKSGPQRARELLGEEADALLRGRFSIVNVWRPIRGPLEDSPLAICDARSLAFEDFVATDLIYEDRTGEIYNVRQNPAHRWFYAPRMGRDEVLLFRCYESAADGRARFVPHAAFEDPTAPQVVIPRESIELRTLVFYSS